MMLFYNSLPQRSSDCVSLLCGACSVVKHLADSSVQGTLSDDYTSVMCYLGNTQECCHNSILTGDNRLYRSLATSIADSLVRQCGLVSVSRR